MFDKWHETYVTGEERARGGLASEGWAQWEHVPQ